MPQKIKAHPIGTRLLFHGYPILSFISLAELNLSLRIGYTYYPEKTVPDRVGVTTGFVHTGVCAHPRPGNRKHSVSG
jgi:hypothetical protein